MFANAGRAAVLKAREAASWVEDLDRVDAASLIGRAAKGEAIGNRTFHKTIAVQMLERLRLKQRARGARCVKVNKKEVKLVIRKRMSEIGWGRILWW